MDGVQDSLVTHIHDVGNLADAEIVDIPIMHGPLLLRREGRHDFGDPVLHDRLLFPDFDYAGCVLTGLLFRLCVGVGTPPLRIGLCRVSGRL